MSNFLIETCQMIFNCQNDGENHYLHFNTFKTETQNLKTFFQICCLHAEVALDALVEAWAAVNLL